jgi:IrrE N-terminal-like domain
VNVPYLSEDYIARSAEALLREHAWARGAVIDPPIPVEDLVEKQLKLSFEFDDMHRLLNRQRIGRDASILGALFKDRIVIDESLDPVEHPARQGRYRFTVAHEIGHRVLHRHLLTANLSQPSAICCSGRAEKRAEWQADFFASCLLMPLGIVKDAWFEMFADGRPRVIKPQNPIFHSLVEVERLEDVLSFSESDLETDNDVLDRIARPLANKFVVSTTAMRIRLEKLGLLHRKVPYHCALTGDA